MYWCTRPSLSTISGSGLSALHRRKKQQLILKFEQSHHRLLSCLNVTLDLICLGLAATTAPLDLTFWILESGRVHNFMLGILYKTSTLADFIIIAIISVGFTVFSTIIIVQISTLVRFCYNNCFCTFFSLISYVVVVTLLTSSALSVSLAPLNSSVTSAPEFWISLFFLNIEW